MRAKLRAQMHGLGVGYLPRHLAERHAAQGELVIKQVAEPKPEVMSHLAWCSDGGKAQQWLLQRFAQLTLDELLM